MTATVLRIDDLRVHLFTRRGVVRAVDGVSFHVDAGETVGLVGESGCGKTMLALSILRLTPDAARIVSGRILVRGQDVTSLDKEAVRRIRGGEVALSFQDPASALDPVMRIGSQVEEAMTAHGRRSRREAGDRVVPLLRRVSIAAPEQRARSYPHQFSGGMRQRVAIAIGIADDPALLIADEATTALDASAQLQMSRLLEQINGDLGTAILLITHNMALVAGLCTRVVVMYAGRIVEEGPVDQIFEDPQHPYTWHLLRSVPHLDGPHVAMPVSILGAPPSLISLPTGCVFHPRCLFREERCAHQEPDLATVRPRQRARCWVTMGAVTDAGARVRTNTTSREPQQRGIEAAASDDGGVILRVQNISKRFALSTAQIVTAVDGVNLDLRRGETLGLIGESGCGKSTLARVIAQLTPADAGTVTFEGQDLEGLRGGALRRVRRHLQIVFQDPFASLDPRMRVGDIVARPLHNFGLVSRGQEERRVRDLLDVVSLGAEMATRYPHELSGGQRQRIGIARALAAEPSLIICDEPVSALDVSVQAQIINLLRELQQRYRLSYLFISHDLAVVRHLCDRVAVMYLGRIVEVGDAADVYDNPRHPYTRALINSVAVPDPRRQRAERRTALEGEAPSPLAVPEGCHFHPRCPMKVVPGICDEVRPRLEPCGTRGQSAACHFKASTPHHSRPVAARHEETDVVHRR